MSVKWAELSVATDVWKSANPEVDQGRTVNQRLASARCGGDERGASGDDVDAEVQAEGGAEPAEAKQTEALGVLSELRAQDLVEKRAEPVKVKSHIGFEVDSARQVFALRLRSAKSVRKLKKV
jgi:hypothetical protein